ncbi:MAG: cation transporter [bacterium]|nr:cation transporter [bacterium]
MSKVKKVYKVEGMDCTSCAMVIESDLEDLGIKAKCNFAKCILEVEYDPNKVPESKVKEVVNSSGYLLS